MPLRAQYFACLENLGQGTGADMRVDYCIDDCLPFLSCNPVTITLILINDEEEPGTVDEIEIILHEAFELHRNPGQFIRDPNPVGQDPAGGNLFRYYLEDLPLPSLLDGFIELKLSVVTQYGLFPNGVFQMRLNVERNGVNFGHNGPPCAQITPDVPAVTIPAGQTRLSDILGMGVGQLPPTNENSAGSDLLVEGEFIIDEGQEYWFTQSSQILMRPGASIVIEKDAILHLIAQTSLKSCTDMWDRIEIQAAGKLDLAGTSATQRVIIRDGERGVQLDDRATLEMKHTTFLNNYRSLSTAVDFSPKSFMIHMEGVNRITSDGNLVAPYEGQLPGYGAQFVEANGVNIMGSSGNTLEFSNLARGMDLVRCNLTAEKLLFRDIVDDPATPSLGTEGIAIRTRTFGQNRKFTYTGYGGSETGFQNCETGIRADDMKMDVSQTKMTQVNQGMEVRRCDGRFVYLSENNIQARRTGIGLYQNMPMYLDLYDNIIRIHDELDLTNSARGRGIRGEETMVTNKTMSYEIVNNLIRVDNAETGIWFQSGFAPILKQNTIDLLDTDRETYFGMDLQGTVFPIVRCNLVNGNGSAGDWKSAIGLNTYQVTNGRYRCNDINDTDIGFNFHSIEDATILSGNNINEHRLGLQILAGSYIGDQIHHGNEWLGTAYGSPGVGGLNGNYGGYNAGSPTFSRFFVDEIEQPTFNTSVNVPFWFFDDPTPGDSYYCNTSSTCPSGTGSDIDELAEEGPGSIDVLDYEIADGFLTPGICDTAVNWTARRHLYRRLTNDPALYAVDTILQNFVSNQSASTIGLFQNIETGIAEMFALDSVTREELAAQESAIQMELAAIYSIDSTLTAGVDSLTADSLLTVRAVHQASLNAVSSENDSLETVIADARVSEANTLRTSNLAIPAVTTPEHNERTVNDIYLQTVAVGVDTFSAQQIADLRDIAEQCPPCGGDAVFMARSLYALVDASVLFSDPDPCDDLDFRAAGKAEDAEPRKFSVSPNPANDVVTIQFEQPGSDAVRELMVYSSSGMVLHRQELMPGQLQYTMNTASFPAGSYYIVLYEDGEKVSVEQLIIIR